MVQKKPIRLTDRLRDPDGIRTHDPQLRRLLLYPAELRDQHDNFRDAKVQLFFDIPNLFLFFLGISFFVEVYNYRLSLDHITKKH